MDRSTSSRTGQVTVNDTAGGTVIVPENPSRKHLIIVNGHATVDIFIGPGNPTLTITTGILLPAVTDATPAPYLVLPGYTGSLKGIAGAGLSAVVSFIELT